MPGQIVPYNESLEPGQYAVEVVFTSYATGDRLRSNVEAAFYRAVDNMRIDAPELWLRFRPREISVTESISPNTHRARMQFEILDLPGGPDVLPVTICSYIVDAFLNYFALRVDGAEVLKITEVSPPSPPTNGEPEPPPEPPKDYTKHILIGAACLAGLWLLTYMGRGSSG